MEEKKQGHENKNEENVIMAGKIDVCWPKGQRRERCCPKNFRGKKLMLKKTSGDLIINVTPGWGLGLTLN